MPLVGLGHVDEELQAAAGELAAHAHPVPGTQPVPFGIHERERHR
jgi:hypothetical protein